jgi:hypothetical protein
MLILQRLRTRRRGSRRRRRWGEAAVWGLVGVGHLEWTLYGGVYLLGEVWGVEQAGGGGVPGGGLGLWLQIQPWKLMMRERKMRSMMVGWGRLGLLEEGNLQQQQQE